MQSATYRGGRPDEPVGHLYPRCELPARAGTAPLGGGTSLFDICTGRAAISEEVHDVRRPNRRIPPPAACRDQHRAVRPGALAAVHGRVWDTGELNQEFEVIGFLAPLVVVRRKADGRKGSLEFQANPRFYFNFVLDDS